MANINNCSYVHAIANLTLVIATKMILSREDVVDIYGECLVPTWK